MLRVILRKIKLFYTDSLPAYFIATPLHSSIYYLLFSSTFKREQHAVLAGKVKHFRETKRDNANIYTLIRNIHRIEKGLLMRPRKDVFALNFIKQTMDIFEKTYQPSSCTENSQIKWAHDVLCEFFNSTGSHPILNVERTRFNNISNQSKIFTPTSIPYKRLQENKPEISYEAFYKLARYRRSVRWFLNKKVPHELLDKAILAANQAPSACNRQPYEYRIIDDPELLKAVRAIPMGLKGYDHNIPVMIVVIGNLDAYSYEGDRHVIYIDGSLANMCFMLALETMGLSSCSVNWPDIEQLERKMEKVLNLEKHQRPIMCMAVGYPDPEGLVAYSEKRSLNDLRKYNQ
ncbi:nitroreductase [Algoriphagus sp. 4150]|uniref:nitroreductase family protein n=1 Tax=Algoriphagus sp. 4150 TaxID=2817756 RepID=UPI0028581B05|nr:nitroreductase family protein [Algoriphagus sp. 4150]MDR7127770.1 nitroreductase [Algoriphagus sp. 4150]